MIENITLVRRLFLWSNNQTSGIALETDFIKKQLYERTNIKTRIKAKYDGKFLTITDKSSVLSNQFEGIELNIKYF